MSAASAKRTPGDGGRLHRDAIVDAAISVADADGINALSMRRVADELGVGAMSLYRHIDDKDALLQAMAEAIGRRYPYPVTQDWPWRRRVEAAVEIDWELYRDHPWVVLIYSTPRYSFGADSLEGLDWLAGGFLQLDVDIVRATEMGIAVWNLVNGIVLATVGESLLSGEAPVRYPVDSPTSWPGGSRWRYRTWPRSSVTTPRTASSMRGPRSTRGWPIYVRDSRPQPR